MPYGGPEEDREEEGEGRLNFGTRCVHITECVRTRSVLVLWRCLNFAAISFGALEAGAVLHTALQPNKPWTFGCWL
jgi:hypothetical protein